MTSIAASKSLDFSRIYDLGYAFSRGALHFEAVGGIEDPDKLLRGELRPRHPIEFQPESGSKARDLIGETYATLQFVSEAFINALLEERVTGWGTYPVRLYDKAGLELPGYHGLAVTGRAGPIDHSKSRIELDPPAVPTGHPTYVERGIYFDHETWDGSDVFIPEGTRAVCVVERVKRALEKRKLTNLHFTPLSELPGMRYSEHPGERASAR